MVVYIWNKFCKITDISVPLFLLHTRRHSVTLLLFNKPEPFGKISRNEYFNSVCHNTVEADASSRTV
jgi:hypothetical protein